MSESAQSQVGDVAVCRWCGTAAYLRAKGDGPIVAGTGAKRNEHWRHIANNDRHCERGNGAVAEPYDGSGPVAEQLRQLTESRNGT